MSMKKKSYKKHRLYYGNSNILKKSKFKHFDGQKRGERIKKSPGIVMKVATRWWHLNIKIKMFYSSLLTDSWYINYYNVTVFLNHNIFSFLKKMLTEHPIFAVSGRKICSKYGPARIQPTAQIRRRPTSR